MPKASKLTDEQKCEIAMDLIGGKLSYADIAASATSVRPIYAQGPGNGDVVSRRKLTGKGTPQTEKLRKKVADLQQVAGDQAARQASGRFRLDPGQRTMTS